MAKIARKRDICYEGKLAPKIAMCSASRKLILRSKITLPWHTAFIRILTLHALLQKKSGVAILVKHTVAFKHVSSQCDKYGRYIILSCEINNAAYTIVNAYAPNTRGDLERLYLTLLIQTIFMTSGDANILLRRTSLSFLRSTSHTEG